MASRRELEELITKLITDPSFINELSPITARSFLKQDRSDIAQDISIAMLKKSPDKLETIEDLKRFFSKVARRMTFKSLLKKKKLILYEIQDTASVSINPYLKLEVRQLEKLILTREEGRKELEIFKMIAQGFNYKEIGKELSMSENNVKITVFRVRQWIRNYNNEAEC